MKRLRVLICFIAVALATITPARADVFLPAYLEVTEQADFSDRYDVLWKVPALDEERVLSVIPVFPENTMPLVEPVRRYAEGATTMRWQIVVPGGLEGKTIRFEGRSQATFSVLVRYRSANGIEQVRRISPSEPGMTIAPRVGSWEVMRSYTWIGIEHIIGGVDHLLFVLALVLIVRGWLRLLATVTAFTLAHSITLALATLDIVRVPGPPVEAVIALSIVFVASEILRLQRGEEGLAAKRPWLVAFVFGLLHGLGFAGALAEVGLPPDAIPLALIFFNVGVELGQIAFIAVILAISAAAQRLAAIERSRAVLRRTITYGIGGIASFWVVERVAAF
jgi:hypothetical protein